MAKKVIKYTKVSSIYIKDMQNLNSVLLRSLKDLNLDEKLNEKMLQKFWKELFGISIVNATRSISLRNKSITITINSSVIKNELMMVKDAILKEFQNKFGQDNIKNLIIY
jgi:predicted nucleic acid-binding Zn ribbon protein